MKEKSPRRAQLTAGMRLSFFALACVLIVIDQATKQWALHALRVGEPQSILGKVLSFSLFYNPGAAFSSFTHSTLVITVIAIAVIIAIPFLTRKITNKLWLAAIALAWAGAGGNLVDRLVRAPGIGRGYVIDFLDYGGFFVGNVADIYLVLAVLFIVLLSFLGVPLARQAGQELAEATENEEI